jgi:long-chain fatty acid transport protein
MKKVISLLALASVFAAGTAFASGYRIPEQSYSSVAKAGAHVASSTEVDSAYYNPANMSWADDAWMAEIDLTYIGLSSIDYTDMRTPAFNGSSETENFLLPTVFVVSPNYNDFRFGFSITAPFGLAKRWNDPFPKLFAEKFELQVVDINPTVSYEFNDMFSIGGGVRLLASTATARNGGTNPSSGTTHSLDLSGDWGTDWGWNLAAAVKPNAQSNISVTYRSNVDMGLSGDANLYLSSPGPIRINTTGDVSLPAPAVLTIAGAYTWDKLTVELTYDRTFWSEYENLDFEFGDPTAEAIFGNPNPKNWDDTNAFRIGAEYEFSEYFIGMLGFAIDENPVPEQFLSFELPDSDALLFSFGGRYLASENMELGFGVLYDHKDSRKVNNGTIMGEFENASAFLLSVGLSYKF